MTDLIAAQPTLYGRTADPAEQYLLALQMIRVAISSPVTPICKVADIEFILRSVKQ